MCQVSGKLKLCTCSSDIDRLKYYWVFYRHNKSKNDFIMGEPIMPAKIDPALNSFNREVLGELLNNGDGFDVPMTAQSKDRLLLAFNISKTVDDEQWLFYEFEFKRGKWKGCDWDPFDLKNRYDEILSGKIRNALNRATL